MKFKRVKRQDALTWKLSKYVFEHWVWSVDNAWSNIRARSSSLSLGNHEIRWRLTTSKCIRNRHVWQRLILWTGFADIDVKKSTCTNFPPIFPNFVANCHKLSELTIPISKTFISLLKTWLIWHKRAQNGKNVTFRGKKIIVSHFQATIAPKVKECLKGIAQHSISYPLSLLSKAR